MDIQALRVTKALSNTALRPSLEGPLVDPRVGEGRCVIAEGKRVAVILNCRNHHDYTALVEVAWKPTGDVTPYWSLLSKGMMPGGARLSDNDIAILEAVKPIIHRAANKRYSHGIRTIGST